MRIYYMDIWTVLKTQFDGRVTFGCKQAVSIVFSLRNGLQRKIRTFFWKGNLNLVCTGNFFFFVGAGWRKGGLG